MNLQDDPGAVFRNAMPETTPPPAQFDLDRIVRDGYRARRRQRAVIGGAGTAGVAAVAAVLALSIGIVPNRDDGTDDVPVADQFGFDPAMAGYPLDAIEPMTGIDTQQKELTEAAKKAFGDLAVDAGFIDAEDFAYEFPSDEEAQEFMDEWDVDYGEVLSEFDLHPDKALLFSPTSKPGNGGQVYLKSYTAHEGDEEADRPALTLDAMLPGGWTAEPGPTGDVAFPQHLISDQASWTDQAPEFTKEVLDDGRTLMTADHGCAYEAAVVYPNGSALRSSWDLDCEDQGREMALGDLRDAMLAMPEIDFDSTGLTPVEELIEFPDAWVVDESWPTEAAADAQTSIDAAYDTIAAAYPDAELRDGTANQHILSGDLARRVYVGDGEMGFTDDTGHPVTYDLTYYLPGGWLPGFDYAMPELYLPPCSREDPNKVCEDATEVNGRTVVLRRITLGESVSYMVYVFDPAGWAVEYDTMVEGDVDGYGREDVIALAASLPAPLYDVTEYDLK
jgi:hypothetical protein